MNRLMEMYIKAYRWIFPKMPSEIFYECSKDLELFEGLCRDDIMDEKRFTMLYSMLDEEYEYYDGERALTPSQVLKLLNNFYEENTVLKKKLKFLNELNKPYKEIIGENQRLKKELDRLHEENGYFNQMRCR